MKTNSFNIEEIIHSISDTLYPDKNEGLVYREEFSNSTGFASTKVKTMRLFAVRDSKLVDLVMYNYVVSPKDNEQNKQQELHFIGMVVDTLAKYIRIT